MKSVISEIPWIFQSFSSIFGDAKILFILYLSGMIGAVFVAAYQIESFLLSLVKVVGQEY